MNNAFKTTPNRVTHRISSSSSVKNAPSTSARIPAVNTPAPLQNGAAKRSRCASCGGGRKF